MEVTSFQTAGDRLQSWRRTLILTHDRADGDAIGAIGAMKRVIELSGRHAEAFLFQDPPPRYRFLTDACGITRWPTSTTDLDHRFDGILILDTCSWQQIEPAADFLRATRLPKIVVDHHRTRDDLTALSPEFLLVSDPSAASACGVLFDFCRDRGWPMDAAARDALFTGLATDTGWFRFPSVDGRTLRAAAELIEQGVKPDIMYSRLFEGHRPARLRLLREALSTLQLHDHATVAVMWLTNEMFQRSEATPADSEDMVNEPLQIGSVVASVLLSAVAGSDQIRVNFRSRSPEIAGRNVDVSAIAAQFGGGGHARAAGARITGNLDEVRDQVLAAVRAACA